MASSRIALDLVVRPTLAWLGPPYVSDEAELMLATIGLVESRFEVRRQEPVAHAMGWWQFERAGGCTEFETSMKLAAFRRAATRLGFSTKASSTHQAIGLGADNLACIMARAVLWLDPKPLPRIGERDAAYEYYLRRWRPGKPSRSRWNVCYAQALEDTESV